MLLLILLLLVLILPLPIIIIILIIIIIIIIIIITIRHLIIRTKFFHSGNFNLPPADAVAVHPAALASGQIPFAQAVQYQEERPSWLLRESEIQLTKKIGAGCYGEVFKVSAPRSGGFRV